MAYECQNFRNGQILTAECLNKIDEWLNYICGKEIVSGEINGNGELVFTLCNGEKMAVGVVRAGGGSGITDAEKELILNLFRNAAYTANMSATFAQLEALWSGSGDEPEEPDEPIDPGVTLTSISVKYSGGDVKVGTALTDLKGIVVTATYSDGNFRTVTGYTLSGTIAKGVNIITVSYGGLTATFTVTGVVPSVTYNVTNNLTGVTNSNAQTSITEGFYSATLTVEDGFMLNSVVVTMGGVDITDSVYTAETGSILITEVTGDIVITAVASEPQYVDMGNYSYISGGVNLYTDDTTKDTYIYSVNVNASKVRTETDAEVSVVLTNNTEADVSCTVYLGSAKEGVRGAFYYYRKNSGIVVRAGQSYTVPSYVVKAGYHFVISAPYDKLDVKVIGNFDVLDLSTIDRLETATVPRSGTVNLYSANNAVDEEKIIYVWDGNFLALTEMFDEDTELRIVMNNIGAGARDKLRVCHITALDKVQGSAFYCESALFGIAGDSVVHLERTFTAKAGYYFAIHNAGSSDQYYITKA